MWKWFRSLFEGRARGAPNHPTLPLQQALIGEWVGTAPCPVPVPGALRLNTRLVVRADSTYLLQFMMIRLVVNDVGTWSTESGRLLISIQDTHWDFHAGSSQRMIAKYEETKASLLESAKSVEKPERVLWFGPDHIHIFDGDRVFFDLKRTKASR